MADNFKYKATNIKKANTYYNTNKEDISEKRKLLYATKKETQAMMNILFLRNVITNDIVSLCNKII